MRGCAKDSTGSWERTRWSLVWLQVEYDRTRNKWQPQYYLMIYGRSAALLEEFCRGYFWAKRTAPQLIIRSTVGKPAKWFSHMCKLSAFEEIMETDGLSREVRLNDKLSREYFHYLADRSPTSFIFCINCNIVTQRVSRPPSDEDDITMKDTSTASRLGRCPGFARRKAILLITS